MTEYDITTRLVGSVLCIRDRLLLDPLAPPSEIDEVGGEIASALDYFKVPAREKQELLAVIVSKKTEVVSS
jgi:hypothetical protein